MALTKAQVREILSAAGVDREHMGDAVDKIIDGHLASINVLREEADKYKGDAEKLPTVQRELDDLKAAGDGGYKDKYEQEKKAFADYKSGVEAKEAKAAKESAVREYLKGKNVKDESMALAIRSLNAEIEAAELDNGKLKSTEAFDNLLAGDLKGLVTTTTETHAPNPANPPKNTGGTMTKDQIMEIKDREERRAAIAANMNLFEKGE